MQIFGAIDVGTTDPAAWNVVLSRAYDDFCLWRRQHKISCSQKRFKYRLLFRDEYGFFLNCKAFNGRLVCEWLLSKLLEIKAAPPAGVILDDRFDLCEAALTLVDTCTNFCHHPQYVLLFWSDYMVSLSEKECPPKEYRLKNRSPIRPIMCFPHWWAGLRNRIHPNHLCPSG